MLGDDLVAVHDAIARLSGYSTADDYRAELARRDVSRQTRTMSRPTRVIAVLTLATWASSLTPSCTRQGRAVAVRFGRRRAYGRSDVLGRRQTLGRTRRELRRSLDADDRERAMDWWTLAEDRMMTTEGQPSGPAVTVALAAIGGLGMNSIETEARLLVVVRAGYSLRAEVHGFVTDAQPLDVSSLDSDSIIRLARRPVDEEGVGAIIFGDDAQEVAAQLEPVSEVIRGFAEERFPALSSVEPAFWNGVVSLATYQLQKNLGKWLHSEFIESLLRWGFALRALDEALGIGPVNEGHDADAPAVAARLVERAHKLTNPMQMSMPEQAETLIAAGPAAVLGQDTWDSWSQGDQDCAVILSRAGFVIRLAELDLLPAARDHDHPSWAGVSEVVLEMTNRFHDAPDGAMPVMAAAASIVQTRVAADALLESIPGPAPDARLAAIQAELEYLREKGVQTTGTDLAQQRNLMVYGFAAAVVREFILVAQERGDAERERRSPHL